MSRAKNTEQRRAQIVSGLLTVMAERGYDGSSVNAIATQAGLSPGLVHYHFGSKEEILLALIEHLDRVVVARFDDRSFRASGPWQRLDAFIDAHLAVDDSTNAAAVSCWVIIGAEALRRKQVRASYETSVRKELAVLESLISDILEEEGLATHSAANMAAGIFAAIQGCFQLAVAANAAPAGFAATTVKQMARGLLAGTGAVP